MARSLQSGTRDSASQQLHPSHLGHPFLKIAKPAIALTCGSFGPTCTGASAPSADTRERPTPRGSGRLQPGSHLGRPRAAGQDLQCRGQLRTGRCFLFLLWYFLFSFGFFGVLFKKVRRVLETFSFVVVFGSKQKGTGA
jgi:hypothetical protein